MPALPATSVSTVCLILPFLLIPWLLLLLPYLLLLCGVIYQHVSLSQSKRTNELLKKKVTKEEENIYQVSQARHRTDDTGCYATNIKQRHLLPLLYDICLSLIFMLSYFTYTRAWIWMMFALHMKRSNGRIQMVPTKMCAPRRRRRSSWRNLEEAACVCLCACTHTRVVYYIWMSLSPHTVELRVV